MDDIHTRTASEVFGVPLAEVTPEQRRSAKAINFQAIYGPTSGTTDPSRVAFMHQWYSSWKQPDIRWDMPGGVIRLVARGLCGQPS